MRCGRTRRWSWLGVATILLVLSATGCGGNVSTERSTTSTTSPTTAPRSPPTSTSVGTAAPATTTTAPVAIPEPATPAPTPEGSGSVTAPLPAGIVSTTLPTTARVVVLTFDAGANGDGMPSILATLRVAGAKATFFLTGNFASHYPGLAAQVAQAGHRIGDHSVDHPHFTALTDAQIDAEVVGAAQSIVRTTGADPAPYFRFPYGESDARTLAEVNRLGYVAVGWTVDTLGWEGTSAGISADTVLSRVLSALRPGEIVLMHVGSNPTDHSTLDADALPRVIAAIAAAGYTFVTLDGSA